MFYELLVGILAVSRPLHYSATLFAQAAQQFVLQILTLRVVVERKDNELLVVEVCLNEAVQEGEILLAAVGHRNGLREATLYKRQGVELALSDVAYVTAQNGVDVVWDELSLGNEAELLVEGAGLLVDEDAMVEVVEGYDTLKCFCLTQRRRVREVVILSDPSVSAWGLNVWQRDLSLLEGLDGEAALLSQVGDQRLCIWLIHTVGNQELGMPSWSEVSCVARQLVLAFLTTAATFLLAAFLVLVGHIALSIAVVAFVQALVYVNAERLVTLVVAVLVTERAEGLDMT